VLIITRREKQLTKFHQFDLEQKEWQREGHRNRQFRKNEDPAVVRADSTCILHRCLRKHLAVPW